MAVSQGDRSSPRAPGEINQTIIQAGVPPAPGVAPPAIIPAGAGVPPAPGVAPPAIIPAVAGVPPSPGVAPLAIIPAGAGVPPSHGVAPPSVNRVGAGVPPSHGVALPASHSGLHRPSPNGASRGYPVSSIAMGHCSQSLMPLIRASVTPATWQVYGDCRPAVWVVGHSYIYWAEKRAMIRPGGKNLGFRNVEVNWRGIRGLRWQQIFPEMVDISRSATGPLVMVIHAGGNDLVKRSTVELLTVMKTDIERLAYLFPDTVWVWSEIVPRAVWHGAKNANGIERSRRKINARMAKFMRERCGIVVRHHQLEGDNSALLRADGVHLTDIGQDILLSGIQDGVDQALKVMGGVGVLCRRYT
ncbi:uncharacterized protein ACNLHF_027016 [Anomaloglossus baeobatrachus]|uniref:uncharacterized protein LOC142249047 n=2 Tax=Anomaloglossus baeobatrachus TaxID=238106 RepID=UPI003F50880A